MRLIVQHKHRSTLRCSSTAISIDTTSAMRMPNIIRTIHCMCAIDEQNSGYQKNLVQCTLWKFRLLWHTPTDCKQRPVLGRPFDIQLRVIMFENKHVWAVSRLHSTSQIHFIEEVHDFWHIADGCFLTLSEPKSSQRTPLLNQARLCWVGAPLWFCRLLWCLLNVRRIEVMISNRNVDIDSNANPNCVQIKSACGVLRCSFHFKYVSPQAGKDQFIQREHLLSFETWLRSSRSIRYDAFISEKVITTRAYNVCFTARTK